MDKAYTGQEKRQHKRVSVLWNGSGAVDSGDEVNCLIYDVSISGLRAKFDQLVKVGQHLVVKIAGSVQLVTEVVWVRGQTVGLRFKEDPMRLASIMVGILPQECLSDKSAA